MEALKLDLFVPKFPSLRALRSEEYHSLVYASASLLKHLLKSPAHLKLALTMEKKATPAMVFGSEFHAALLENIEPSKKNAEDIHDLVRSVKATPIANTILSSVDAREMCCFWEEGGVKCKAKVDAYSTALKAVIDVKTTTDGSPDSFRWSLKDFGYHIQGAHYVSGLAANGIEVDSVILIVVEKNTGVVACYEIGERTLRAAEILRKRLLKKWKECFERDEWPGYSETVQIINLSDFELGKIEDSAPPTSDEAIEKLGDYNESTNAN